ncbi:helix-turn-helix domain-containing protein [Mycobacterium intracellulare subsp. chimaera]|uniref:helix-turn-helix domain-containing protein n=1 Tax=Mycobacterium intracellulare TaxID=1767 RepID=UPI00093C17F1|nr:helix-turn-helix domain-containing protein [Mycobacterium intracellulare]ARV85074.1 DNA-binding protein [Mycobacterium intracellulare subsp. chimaera]ASL09166.1 DNA binding domain, excisionase family [Mycobacterium intracellulare subsp. chimaera]ASL20981.1 DNA binding domain, excisionase family [Mycobacterium intracellulare subsp. chimaera]MCV7326909.1 helix-turn-helix domain-containing protein [Mycobacterium intracellulare subsp. chimaera]MDM3904214.1 helix-turn-helix domain-containing pro
MASTATEVAATAVDWPQRITSHVNAHDGSVVVPQRVAKWLHARAPVPYEQRLLLRERDPELYAVINALRMTALSDPESWPATSDLGSKMAKPTTPQQESESEWLTTRRASEIAGVTDRAIRDWIATKRLPARRHGHTWRIHRTDLQAATQAA